MIVLRYPPKVLTGDYLRSGVGLVVGLGVLTAVPPSLPILIIFGGIALLFGVFGIRTLHRHKLEVVLDEEAIACRGLTTRVLPWAALELMKLRYFGTRRGKRSVLGGGFMELTLKGAGITLKFESSLEDFEKLAEVSARASGRKGLEMDPATASNLIDLGIDGAAADRAGCDSPPNVL